MSSTPAANQQLLELAEAALNHGNPDTTLEICQQFLEHNPEHPGAMFLEAEAYRDLREIDEAESRYRRVLELQPSHSEAWSGMGAILFDDFRFEEAARCFGRALRAQPENADAYYGRALVRERRSDFRGARRDYLRAWRYSSSYPLPTTLTDADVRAMLQEAAKELDPSIGVYLGQAALLIRDLPDIETCALYEPAASPAELLGHFAAPLAEDRDAGKPWSNLPPALVVYRKNLERYAADLPQLLEAVRQTLLSHVADWLGVDPELL